MAQLYSSDTANTDAFCFFTGSECFAYRRCDTGSSNASDWLTNYRTGSSWLGHFWCLRYCTLSTTGCVYTTAISYFPRGVPWSLTLSRRVSSTSGGCSVCFR